MLRLIRVRQKMISLCTNWSQIKIECSIAKPYFSLNFFSGKNFNSTWNQAISPFSWILSLPIWSVAITQYIICLFLKLHSFSTMCLKRNWCSYVNLILLLMLIYSRSRLHGNILYSDGYFAAHMPCDGCVCVQVRTLVQHECLLINLVLVSQMIQTYHLNNS